MTEAKERYYIVHSREENVYMIFDRQATEDENVGNSILSVSKEGAKLVRDALNSIQSKVLIDIETEKWLKDKIEMCQRTEQDYRGLRQSSTYFSKEVQEKLKDLPMFISLSTAIQRVKP